METPVCMSKDQSGLTYAEFEQPPCSLQSQRDDDHHHGLMQSSAAAGGNGFLTGGRYQNITTSGGRGLLRGPRLYVPVCCFSESLRD